MPILKSDGFKAQGRPSCRNREGMLCGLAALSDTLRTEAAEAVRRLRKSCTRFRSPAPWI